MPQRDVEVARRRARLESILEAALEVFSEAGFEGLTIQRVADAAGIAKGTVYLYFEDRETLVAQAIWHAFEKVVAELEAIATGVGGVRQRLRAIAVAQLEHIQGQLAFYRALMRTPTLDDAEPERDPRHRAYVDLQRRVVRAIAHVVEEHRPPLRAPDEVAWAFQHLIHGASIRLLVDPAAPGPSRQAEDLVRLLFEGADGVRREAGS